MKITRTILMTPLLALSLVPVAQAHDVWLLPSSTVLSREGPVTVDGAVSNDTFHFTYRPLRIQDNLHITGPQGISVEPENVMQGNLRTVFDANLPESGSYRLALVNASVMASWKEGDETRRWRGRHDDMAENVPAEAEELSLRESISRIETFVTVRSPSDIPATDQGLELVPVTHPNDLYHGEAATFAFMLNGEPAAEVEVNIMAGGTRYRDQLERVTLTTDAEGRISYTWPAPGMYWVSASSHDENATLANAQRRTSYAVTLEVLPQ
ncbi:MAG: DUF4198 domain-containing protein [Pseudomonadaceae bacterium]|nr:MAG: DUF4198 domain-containing protein [Pseudomonadaceae bacterium]